MKNPFILTAFLSLMSVKLVMAADIFRWPVNLDSYLVYTKECEQLVKAAEGTDSADAINALPANAVTRVYIANLKKQACAVTRINKSFKEPGTPICPGVSLDNFHICYRKIADSLLSKKQMQPMSLMILQAAGVNYIVFKMGKNKTNDSIKLELVEVILATIEASKSTMNSIPSSSDQESQLVRKISDMTLRAFVRKNIEKADDILKKRIGSRDAPSSLKAWRADLERRLDDAKVAWKYPDHELDAELEALKSKASQP